MCDVCGVGLIPDSQRGEKGPREQRLGGRPGRLGAWEAWEAREAMSLGRTRSETVDTLLGAARGSRADQL